MLSSQDTNRSKNTRHETSSENGHSNRDYLQELIQIMNRLRSDHGCPWDQLQTHQSLKEFLAEETAELCDAIDENDDENMREELGDVLLQVIFHCQIAKEENRFDFQDVARTVCEKLIRRHPHVFAETKLREAHEVVTQWEQIKLGEKSGPKAKSKLDGVPRSLPALHRAHKVQKKAAKLGFDWPDCEGVISKIEEELAELRQAMENNQEEQVAEEIGDLLFSVVNLSRFRHHLAENLLHNAVRKFQTRFLMLEEKLEVQGRKPEECSLEELESTWQQAKEEIKRNT